MQRVSRVFVAPGHFLDGPTNLLDLSEIRRLYMEEDAQPATVGKFLFHVRGFCGQIWRPVLHETVLFVGDGDTGFAAIYLQMSNCRRKRFCLVDWMAKHLQYIPNGIDTVMSTVLYVLNRNAFESNRPNASAVRRVRTEDLNFHRRVVCRVKSASDLKCKTFLILLFYEGRGDSHDDVLLSLREMTTKPLINSPTRPLTYLTYSCHEHSTHTWTHHIIININIGRNRKFR